MIARMLLALALVCVGFSLLFAQSTGKIVGKVVDASTGEPLPGVNVYLVGTTYGSISAADGYYAILHVKPGTYTLQASFVGYARVTVENVIVQPGKTTTVDIQLQPTVIMGEEVVVEATRPVVEIDRTTTTAYVTEEQLQSLPVLSVGEVINLQAGVVDGHFRGGRLGEVTYLVNGVPIDNAFSREAAFEVEQNMIQSLEVISGVFNAEYGQAMSGVVNIVTRDVPDGWSGSVQGQLGSVASNWKVPFVRRLAPPGSNLRADDFTEEWVPQYRAVPFPGIQDVQLSLGGPVLSKKLGVLVTARHFVDKGYHVARRVFMPADSSQNLNSGLGRESWIIESTGDQAFIPLNGIRRNSIQTTLTYRMGGPNKLEYSLFWQKGRGRLFIHQRKYVPEGINHDYLFSMMHLLSLTLGINATTFADISYGFLHDKFDRRLYDSPYDDRYVPAEYDFLQGAYAFNVGGNELYTLDHLTQTHTLVASVLSQVTRVHQAKAGIQLRYHRIDNHDFGIERSFRTGYRPQPSPDPFSNNKLKANPVEFAAYVQDRMEFKNLVVNAGIRFDYFDPDYLIPVDWTQAAREYIPDLSSPGDSIYNRRPADTHYQVSPRLGLAFPISASGVLRFSAGLFFQVPAFSILYSNPEYEVNPTSQVNAFGNPALDPERTLAFEMGFQQALTSSIGLEMTLYAKDIRNLVGQEILRDPRGDFVIRWVNHDFGVVRGVTFSLFQRPRGGMHWTLDYTLQFAEGSASNPDETFQLQQSGLEPVLRPQRLNWDRRHVLNQTLSLNLIRGLTFSIINRFVTGTPYTTVRNFIRSFERNNADKPSYYTGDIRLDYRPPVFKDRLAFVLQIDNFTDTHAHWAVYEDTGLATESFEKELVRRTGGEVGGVNTLDDYFFRQDFFGPPRRVTVGLRVDF